MRLALAAPLLALLATPAAAQERGIFIFDFASDTQAERAALADRIVADAQDIADAAAIFCTSVGGYRGRDHRHEVMSLLVQAGAEPQRMLDAGTCTPEITGRSNARIGADRIWLALSNVAFLESWRRERMGL